jgi:pectin methylesterase-like acyl-CoA thioesterase
MWDYVDATYRDLGSFASIPGATGSRGDTGDQGPRGYPGESVSSFVVSSASNQTGKYSSVQMAIEAAFNLGHNASNPTCIYLLPGVHQNDSTIEVRDGISIVGIAASACEVQAAMLIVGGNVALAHFTLRPPLDLHPGAVLSMTGGGQITLNSVNVIAAQNADIESVIVVTGHNSDVRVTSCTVVAEDHSPDNFTVKMSGGNLAFDGCEISGPRILVTGNLDGGGSLTFNHCTVNSVLITRQVGDGSPSAGTILASIVALQSLIISAGSGESTFQLGRFCEIGVAHSIVVSDVPSATLTHLVTGDSTGTFLRAALYQGNIGGVISIQAGVKRPALAAV